MSGTRGSSFANASDSDASDICRTLPRESFDRLCLFALLSSERDARELVKMPVDVELTLDSDTLRCSINRKNYCQKVIPVDWSQVIDMINNEMINSELERTF